MNRIILSPVKRAVRFASSFISINHIPAICAFSIALVAGIGCAFAKPASPNPILYTQPDGSIINIILKGDENGHKIFTEDGTLLEKGSDGMLRPSLLRTSDISTTTKKKYTFSGTHFPSEGEARALVVLVNYSDNRFSMADPHDYFNRMLNEEGFSDNGASGSARDFFIENSMGKFRPHFDVYGPLTLREPGIYYGGNDMDGIDFHPDEMCIEACQQLDDTVDFSIYDLDNDGYIDNMYIFYAGFGEADTGTSTLIWPHSATLEDYNHKDEYSFDGKILNSYGMSNEMDYTYQRPDGIGTFVHEFSHVLGLPDLYATSYSFACTPGYYSTMDVGSYNDEGRTPPFLSLFERLSLGWCSPTTLVAEGDYTLSPLNISNDGLLIPTDDEDEFIILDCRKQELNDAFIPAEGMLVWHIDFNQNIWDDNIVNNLVNHQYVDIVEADGRSTSFTRAGDTFPGSTNNTSLSFETEPSLQSWSKQSTGFSISNIARRAADGHITFTVTKDQSAGVDDISASSLPWVISGNRLLNVSDCNLQIYSLDGQLINNLTSGSEVSLSKGIYLIHYDTPTDIKTCKIII